MAAPGSESHVEKPSSISTLVNSQLRLFRKEEEIFFILL